MPPAVFRIRVDEGYSATFGYSVTYIVIEWKFSLYEGFKGCLYRITHDAQQPSSTELHMMHSRRSTRVITVALTAVLDNKFINLMIILPLDCSQIFQIKIRVIRTQKCDKKKLD